MLAYRNAFCIVFMLISVICGKLFCENNFPNNESKSDLEEIDPLLNAPVENISFFENEPIANVTEITESSSSTLAMEYDENVIKTSSETTASNFPTKPTRETAPENTFALWDNNGKICLLAKFFGVFSITYPSDLGEQIVVVDLPQGAAVVKGRCSSKSKPPLLHLIWDKFAFNISFSKLSGEDEKMWSITSMALGYDTSGPLFDRAANAGKRIAKSQEFELFEIPFGKSYFCPLREISLYIDDRQVATVRLKSIHLQPYDVQGGKFSSGFRCNQVIINGEEEPFVQDETIPLAVGCTLAILTLIILVGFSIHRAYTAAKVDYNSME